METTPVATDPGGLVVPYAALVYDTDGSTWVFVRQEPLTYQRSPVTVAGKDGDRVVLTDGPSAGTEVVTVGAAELVGLEVGIDGEE
jgi:multidrug efflux pump subunit AcrA (membrane-fusion protein)